MAAPEGLRKPRRAALLVPLGLALIVALGALALALSHLAAKGPAPQLGESANQAATGSGPPSRDAYTSQDYVEPRSQ